MTIDIQVADRKNTLAGIDPQRIRFGKCEVEEAARGLIEFLRERASLGPFRYEELVDYYRRTGRDTRYMLFGLMCAWEDDATFEFHEPHAYIVAGTDGSLSITKYFLSCCRDQS